MIFSRFLPQTMLMTLFHVESELQIIDLSVDTDAE